MGPHVVRLEQQSTGKPAQQRCLQGIEVIVAVVRFQAEGAEIGQRPQTCRRIDQVDTVPGEEVMPAAADVTKLRHKIVR